MQLVVKSITGTSITVDVEHTDKIKDIKLAIQEKEGIPYEQQRIIYAGRSLADDKNIEEYKIQAGNVLHMVLQLRGG
jgi:ubiquitin